MSAWKPLCSSLLSVLFLVSLCSLARADEAMAYEALIRRAVAEYQSGAWEEARALFQEAHALEPNARTLRGLGLTAYELHRYVECIADFEAALTHPERPLDAAQRKEVAGLLARAKGFISAYELELEPVDAQVLIDGGQASFRDGLVLLDPGVHTLVVRAEGYTESHQQLRVPAGARRSLRIVLQAEAKQVEQPVSKGPAVQATPHAAQDDDVRATPAGLPQRQHAYTWGFGTAATISFATGASLWLAAFAKSKDAQACDPNVRSCEPLADMGRTLERASFVAYGAGAALGISSLVAFLLERRSEPHQTRLVVEASLRRIIVRTHF